MPNCINIRLTKKQVETLQPLQDLVLEANRNGEAPALLAQIILDDTRVGSRRVRRPTASVIFLDRATANKIKKYFEFKNH